METSKYIGPKKQFSLFYFQQNIYNKVGTFSSASLKILFRWTSAVSYLSPPARASMSNFLSNSMSISISWETWVLSVISQQLLCFYYKFTALQNWELQFTKHKINNRLLPPLPAVSCCWFFVVVYLAALACLRASVGTTTSSGRFHTGISLFLTHVWKYPQPSLCCVRGDWTPTLSSLPGCVDMSLCSFCRLVVQFELTAVHILSLEFWLLSALPVYPSIGFSVWIFCYTMFSGSFSTLQFTKSMFHIERWSNGEIEEGDRIKRLVIIYKSLLAQKMQLCFLKRSCI